MTMRLRYCQNKNNTPLHVEVKQYLVVRLLTKTDGLKMVFVCTCTLDCLIYLKQSDTKSPIQQGDHNKTIKILLMCISEV